MVMLNGFGVKIIGDVPFGKLSDDGENYVAIPNMTKYKICLINNNSTETMAEVYVEDENVGTWFINPNSSIEIERPANVNRNFTFVRERSSVARSAGVIPGNEVNGLIEVVFYPKKQKISYVRASSPSKFTLQTRSLSPSSVSPIKKQTSMYSSGSTVLGSRTNQHFHTRNRYSDEEIDQNKITTITLRLIVKDNGWSRSFGYDVTSESSSSYIDDSDEYDDIYTKPYTSVGKGLRSYRNQYPRRIEDKYVSKKYY